ncbi:metal-dependent hydrolase [Cohnella sp. CFH 77786]|uniref:metal-dependent hydrolase n=1 Tax=Cohnella sp. CFH 77786 TaxID=2662265 RepID=UPI001C60AF39|nr:metal-dependent hydrolase [Cohnella sp. CFH 77786]MBW5447254.1 metal-dependent hydrolase [Cohnella sp. CFH 77786]
MDTGTHFVFGLGLGGLAMIDPVISSHPHGAVAVLIGTVIGSNAPDLDMLLRMKSNADYIKHHRGLSHSVPAVLLWSSLITLVLSLSFRAIPWWHLGFWILLSVVLHVFTDLFNSYGTQAYRPFSREWVKWNIIHIFDPFIFFAHLLAILMWGAGLAEPRVIFPVLYVLLAVYYVWRTFVHRKLTRILSSADPEGRPGDVYTLLPTLSHHRWNVVRRSEDGLYAVGDWNNGRLTWADTLTCDNHPAVEASKSHPDVQAFLGITPFPCASVRQQSWGYEVRWVDIRYRYRRQYPFVAVVLMDFSYVPLQSYVGWLSEERLEKRLRMTTY